MAPLNTVDTVISNVIVNQPIAGEDRRFDKVDGRSTLIRDAVDALDFAVGMASGSPNRRP